MTFLSDKFAKWAEGPYAMQAIVGCAIEDKPGSWFVQLRTPADDLFDQVVLTNAWGKTREEAIENARRHDPAIREVIEWDKKIVASNAQMSLFPVAGPGLRAVMLDCEFAIGRLCDTINTLHDGI
jgi:hypothetical protein